MIFGENSDFLSRQIISSTKDTVSMIFPQRDYKTRMISSLLILLTKIPTMRKEIYRKRMKEEMVKPLQKMLEKME